MNFIIGVYILYITCYGVNAFSCTSDADCPQGANLTCNDAGQCECPPSYFLQVNTCIYDCGNPPAFEVDGMDFTFTLPNGNSREGDFVYYDCPDGYTMSGDDESQCMEGGWSDVLPICTQIQGCGNLTVIANGNLSLDNSTNTFVGSTARVNCEEGYIESQSSIECLGTGKWEIASCTQIDCDAVPDVPNGLLTLPEGETTTYGTLADVTCNSGYNPVSKTIKCLETGNWETAQCEIINCGNLDDPMNGTVDTANGTTYGSNATYACDEGFDIVGDERRVCLQNGKWSNMKPDCLLEGAKKCPINTDTRGTVWKELSAGKNRTNDCETNFNGIIVRQCGIDGVWKIPEYLCMRESVRNAIRKIDLLNKTASQQDVLNCLQSLKNVTTPAKNVVEQGILTDLEVSSLIASTRTIANLISDSPSFISDELINELAETISNLIDDVNNGSWNAITQTSSILAEKMLLSVEALSNGMANRVASSGIGLQPVVKENLALHVTAITSDKFIFPGPDTVKGTSSNSWLRETRSQINFNPASLGGTVQQYVVKAAMFKDLSAILPGKSDDEQLNGQILSFSTLPPLTGTIDPPIKMSFEQNNNKLTNATCSFWKYDDSGSDGYWSTEGCSAISTSEGLTECACNHTTNFAVILSLQDCGNLNNLINGTVLTPEGTTLNREAVYSCTQGYYLNGTTTRLCLSTGSWSSSPPSCIEIKEGQTIDTCLEDIDSRGLTWPETISGNSNDKRCHEGFTGVISRKCDSVGEWKLPQYNCIRESIVKVIEKVSNFNENATEEEIDKVLVEMVKVTSFNETTGKNNTLTDGELSVLSTSLETIASILESSSGIINEKITEKFIVIASNLADDSNQESWRSLSQLEDNGDSEKLLKAVDSLTKILSGTINDDFNNNGTFIVKKNIAIEVKRVSNKDIIFPDPNAPVPNKADEDTKWFKETSSSLRLDANALINASVTYTTTTVIYRDLSKILPNQRDNNTNENSEDSNYALNAPILSLTISPPVAYKLEPPLKLTFSHYQINYTDPWCVYWVFGKKFGQGFWSSEGCIVNTTNINYTVCECDHLTNFAVLMSPFIEADAASEALRIISMVGIGISIACLGVTLIIHICLWRYLRSDRTAALFNLCVALLLSYILFLAGVDRTESSVACAVIAAVLQYIYLVVFCIMLVEGIEIAITVLYVFKTKSRIKVMLVIAWVIPAIIVGISLGVTQADGYGNDNYCWLTVDNGLIWAFVGPALLVITFNAICLIIVIRVMFKTRAMAVKKASEKIKTSFRSLCVLVPIMGVSWILGIFYMSDTFYFIQYIFAILNGLQGFFIFLFHCLLNEHVKKAIRLLNRRRSSANETFFNSSKEERKSKDIKDIRTSIVNSGESAQTDNKVGENEKVEPQILKLDVKISTPQGNGGHCRRVALVTK